MDEAIAAELAGERLRFVHFWGHAPGPDGPGAECLSQWWPGEFSEDGRVFASTEHYMMAHKAWLFGDEDGAEKILEAGHPGEARRLGREVRGFESEVWEAHRFAIVTRGNVAKFAQHPELRRFLEGTRERILVEASPKDRVWGIGLSADDPGADSPSAWKGLNLLGFALMEARARLAGPVLRRAEDADAERIGEVFLAARAGMDYLPRLHSDEETRWWIEHVVLTECEVRVAEVGGRVVGFAALNGPRLDHLYVDPEYQGIGIGSELLQSAMETRGPGLELRVFEQNVAAMRFYERHGFSIVERDDGSGNEERLPDVLYRR